MTDRIKQVFVNVEQLYSTTTRQEARYLWKNHVQVVAKYADELSHTFGGNADLAIAGALLHDVADIWMQRDDAAFEAKTRGTVDKVLKDAGFALKEINFIKDEVIDPHSCHPGNLPTTLEGKILATADSLAHLTTNFYHEIYKEFFTQRKTPAEYKDWVQKKLQRDFESKIFFEEVRTKVEPQYQQLKKDFS